MNQLNMKKEIDNVNYKRKGTLYKHQTLIREYLNIKQYDDTGKKLLIEAITKNSYTMDNPADLINSAIDILVKNNYELPAYSHIDKLTLEIRSKALNEIFERTLESITKETKDLLDNILEVDEDKNFSYFNYLKEPSKKTTFKNMKDLISKLRLAESLGNFKDILISIPYAKVQHFAKEVYSLDASELKKYSDSKRYTLLNS